MIFGAKRKKILALTLVLIFSLLSSGCVSIADFWSKVVKPANKVSPKKIAQKKPTASKKEKTTKASKPGKKAVKKPKKMIDPFSLRVRVYTKDELEQTKKATAEVAGRKIKLEGTWISNTTRVAFISGQAINIGGVVLGWRVVKITKNKVYLKKGKEEKVLTLEDT